MAEKKVVEEPKKEAAAEPQATAAPTPVIVPGVTAEEGAQMRRALRELAGITVLLLEQEFRSARPMHQEDVIAMRDKAAAIQQRYS